MKISKNELEKIVIEETVREITSAAGGDLDLGGPFRGGSIDIDPLSDEEQETSHDAYYDLRSFLEDDGTWVESESGRPPAALPGVKPSDKLRHALRWIAKFEGGVSASDDDATGDSLRQFMRNAPGVKRSKDGSRSLEEGIATHPETGEMAVTATPGDSEWPSDAEFGAARQDDLQATMLKAAMEIKNNSPQTAYETLLRALAAAGMDEKYLDDFMGYGDLEEYRSDGSTRSANTAPRPDSSTHKKKREPRPSSDTRSSNSRYRSTGAN